ncbi:MAG: polymerase subunit alpha, polymerase subunit alpha protein [Parcubacteria group bacterium]|nr:polymerase subunit alpha, polymerase subunit alpha protein [Parcubacteria group bacterium]
MHMSKFTHLHVHSHYSLLDALPKISDLIEKAKKLNMTALALTDSGNLYGAIEFYKECKDEEIKPIIGVDFYVASRTRFDKEARIDNNRSRLVLLAENEEGYKNLLKLVTYSNLEGFYYKARIDKELIEKYAKGLVCIMPSFSGEITKILGMHDEEKATALIDWYKNIFGPDHFYIEITHHPEIAGHEDRMRDLISFARKTNTPIMAAHDVYYLEPEDKAARDTVQAIQGHMGGGGGGSFNDEEEDFSFINEKTALRLFKETPDALENTQKIADMCNLELKLGQWAFPDLEIPNGQTPDEALREIVFSGIKRRGLEETPEVLDRIEYELKIIKDKGYPKYFLVVSDLLRFAHENGILTNIRGSVAGSLVTYLAGITNVNPLEFKLPFERFLNPDRPSAPDIDMDFADNRRDEVIEYSRKKYGADKVAQIGTFGTMMARGAVRDVARAMGFPYGLGDQIAKLIPMGAQGFPMTIDRALKENPDLKKLYKEDADTKTVMDMAKKIEGNARHISVHAAGVVISPGPMTDYTALQFDTKGENKIITQYDMYSIDENNVGLLKFDFLGIRNLAIIADALDRIKKMEGKEIDMEDIPIDDKKTFEMLARGETEGTFQLNGDGMTKALTELKPTNIHDINVMVALYRPGPMDNIQEYIARKHGTKPATYMHPKMKDFLDTTFGVLVYQDDLLMTAIEVAGYSWGEVDKFRKAIGKKIPEEMKKQHVIFVEGCQKHGGMSKEKAEALWDLFVPFQGYGFNKAHAASYGHIAYITAWLKANYPAIYMSAVLTAESGDVETVGIMVQECKRMGIPVLPPSVNESYSQFTVIKNEDENINQPYKIRFGLTTIKNFGQGISTAIIEERKRAGKFTSLINFLDRIKDRNLNKKSVEALIKSGAFDELPSSDGGEPVDRGILMANIDNILGHNKEKHGAPENQDSLFGMMTDTSTLPTLRLADAPLATKKDKLLWEKELLGLYLSGHPLEEFKDKLSKLEGGVKKLEECKEGHECIVAGQIVSIREVMTKKGERMVFVNLEDLTGSLDVVIFPKVFEEFKALLVVDNCVAMKGKVSKRNDATSFIADKVKVL